MARRPKKKPRLAFPSPGPLPARRAGEFDGRLLVFSDASCKHRGGLAAVIFATADEPQVAVRSVPPAGSNELELAAAVFALQQAARHFPGRSCALFSDNHDAVLRLARALAGSFADDPELAAMLGPATAAHAREHAVVRWIKGHGTCRGNLLADRLAGEAAA